MRIYFCLVALLIAACSSGGAYDGYGPGCVSDGPSASETILTPNSAVVGEGSGSVDVNVSFDYKARDANISFIEYRVEDANGTRIEGAVINQTLKGSGTYAFNIVISTQSAQVFTVRVRLNDYCGERNKWHDATFEVSAVAALVGKTDYVTARLNDLVYFVGGRDASGEISSSLIQYDHFTGQAEAKAPMPEGRESAAAAAYNGVVYVFGGTVYGFEQSSILAYDTATDSWTAVAPMSHESSGANAIAIDDLIYVQGRDHVDRYDPLLDLWMEAAPSTGR